MNELKGRSSKIHKFGFTLFCVRTRIIDYKKEGGTQVSRRICINMAATTTKLG